LARFPEGASFVDDRKEGYRKGSTHLPAHLQFGLPERGIWQRRYWEHTIRDDDDFARHIDYIHINPVKHRLVTWVANWPYSSFHRLVKLGIYPSDWAGDVLNDSENFGERRERSLG
jgi:hypothetical protein